jgi:cytolethal distending toxin subunit B
MRTIKPLGIRANQQGAAMNITTWNMQGGNASTENKWQEDVQGLFASKDSHIRPDIMCIQEAGPFPKSATHVSDVTVPGPTHGSTARVQIYQYGGSTGRPWGTLVFYQWDELGNRVNVALLFPGPPPTNVALAWTAHGPSWRPALGVVYNNAWVFSFHAISPGGPDGQEMLKSAAQIAGTAPWYVAGDWNREPANLVVPSGSTICPPGGPTYPATRPVSKYDYIVRSGATAVTGALTSVNTSDHIAVAYSF